MDEHDLRRRIASISGISGVRELTPAEKDELTALRYELALVRAKNALPPALTSEQRALLVGVLAAHLADQVQEAVAPRHIATPAA
jgi:hypothetical protein